MGPFSAAPLEPVAMVICIKCFFCPSQLIKGTQGVCVCVCVCVVRGRHVKEHLDVLTWLTHSLSALKIQHLERSEVKKPYPGVLGSFCLFLPCDQRQPVKHQFKLYDTIEGFHNHKQVWCETVKLHIKIRFFSGAFHGLNVFL